MAAVRIGKRASENGTGRCDRQKVSLVGDGRQAASPRGSIPLSLSLFPGIRSEFDQIDTSNPNCVVIADAGESFSYQNMNKAFQVLMELENPVLISLGKG